MAMRLSQCVSVFNHTVHLGPFHVAMSVHFQHPLHVHSQHSFFSSLTLKIQVIKPIVENDLRGKKLKMPLAAKQRKVENDLGGEW